MLRLPPVARSGRTALTCAALAAIWLGAAMPAAQAQTIGVTVDSKSNVFLAGRTQAEVPAGTHPNGPGNLPPFVSLAPGVGRAIRFDSVTGSVSYNDVDAPAPFRGQYNGPDGGAVWFKDDNFPSQFLTTASPPGLINPLELGPNPSRPGAYPLGSTTFYVDMDPFGGISGMQLFESDPAERRVMFLAGVFLDDTDPIGLTAPSSLDFGSGGLGRSFTLSLPCCSRSSTSATASPAKAREPRSRSSCRTPQRGSSSASWTAPTSSANRTTTTTTSAPSRCN